MNNDEELRKKYLALYDQEILNLITDDTNKFQSGAFELLEQEVKRRGLGSEVVRMKKEKEIAEYRVCPTCNEQNNPRFLKCWKCERLFSSVDSSLTTMLRPFNGSRVKPVHFMDILKFLMGLLVGIAAAFIYIALISGLTVISPIFYRVFFIATIVGFFFLARLLRRLSRNNRLSIFMMATASWFMVFFLCFGFWIFIFSFLKRT